MEWPKRARTADWENGVLALDREKQFEVPKLTAEIMERLAGYPHRRLFPRFFRHAQAAHPAADRERRDRRQRPVRPARL